LWPRTPDKVFSVTEAWAEENPETLRRLLGALIRAAAWADAQENRAALAAILSQPGYVGAPADVIARSLTDIVYHAGAAGAPQPAHAGWLLTQMMRWGHVAPETDIAAVARQVYRPEIYAAAAASLGMAPIAAADSLEGYGTRGLYRLEDSAAEAEAAPLSRVRRG
jgi:NitT/TauT family transport system ATP-binding protein/nitrate/nitrite transport system substrate-binding protein